MPIIYLILGLAQFFIFFLLTSLLVILIIHIILGVFLNKFSKVLYGCKQGKVWIPFVNIYLLGKWTFNRFCGWFLTLLSFVLFFDYYLKIIISRDFNLLSEQIKNIMIFINNIALFLTFIIARIDYSYLKTEQKNNEQTENDSIEKKE